MQGPVDFRAAGVRERPLHRPQFASAPPTSLILGRFCPNRTGPVSAKDVQVQSCCCLVSSRLCAKQFPGTQTANHGGEKSHSNQTPKPPHHTTRRENHTTGGEKSLDLVIPLCSCGTAWALTCGMAGWFGLGLFLRVIPSRPLPGTARALRVGVESLWNRITHREKGTGNCRRLLRIPNLEDPTASRQGLQQDQS